MFDDAAVEAYGFPVLMRDSNWPDVVPARQTPSILGASCQSGSQKYQ
jgi:hypothetical protein